MSIPKRNILIISYYFHPQISPRAFRAYELAKELSKNYNVQVLTPVPPTSSHQPFEQISLPRGIRKLKSQPQNAPPLKTFAMQESPLKNALRKLLHFSLPGGLSTLFGISVYRNRHLLKEKYAAIISIGLPLGSHLGAYLLKKKLHMTDNMILDYGDPFSRNPKSHWSPFNYLFEKTLLNRTNHVVVPVKNAIPAFYGLIATDKINVIPQGLNIEEVETEDYKRNSIPKIAYAGLFYKDIRDPEGFLRKALGLAQNFKLIFLTDTTSAENNQLLSKYKEMDIHGRLQILEAIPRKQCISFLSTCDFLINFRNKSATQSPSKLIDYTLAKRPILDICSDTSDTSVFEKFLVEDYSQAQSPIDLNDYDIRTVAKKFSALIEATQ
ncbi:hypothetical protein [Bdellovibrio sp. HCB288]|uniref:hypothetical protein n=1 Tax=Bdellovibrio sp. HCB288 TaxID=3394355 RepID=UPI0039B37722